MNYLPRSGIVDLNINKHFGHSFIHIFSDYIINTQKNIYKNKDIFSGFNIGFLGSTSFLINLTSKGNTQFENLNTLKYINLQNTLIAPKSFVGGLGYQYASAIYTLISNKHLFNLKDVFKYSNYMKFSNELYYQLLKNVNITTTKLVESGYLDLNNITIGDYIRYYTDIIKLNKFLMDDNFNSKILDFQKWMLKSGYYDPNLNDIVRIVKDVNIDINYKTNKPVINFTLMFLDASTLNKYLVGNVDDLNKFVDILQKNEKFNIISEVGLLELKKKFKPLL